MRDELSTGLRPAPGICDIDADLVGALLCPYPPDLVGLLVVSLCRGWQFASVLPATSRGGGVVGNLTIRNLDGRVIERLKVQAKANQRSLEGEIRHLLTQHVDRPGRIVEFRERTRQLVSLTAGPYQSDSVDLLREDRDR